MAEAQKERLRQQLEKLKDSLAVHNVRALASLLWSNGHIAIDDQEEILICRTTAEAVRELVRIVMNRSCYKGLADALMSIERKDLAETVNSEAAKALKSAQPATYHPPTALTQQFAQSRGPSEAKSLYAAVQLRMSMRRTYLEVQVLLHSDKKALLSWQEALKDKDFHQHDLPLLELDLPPPELVTLPGFDVNEPISARLTSTSVGGVTLYHHGCSETTPDQPPPDYRTCKPHAWLFKLADQLRADTRQFCLHLHKTSPAQEPSEKTWSDEICKAFTIPYRPGSCFLYPLGFTLDNKRVVPDDLCVTKAQPKTSFVSTTGAYLHDSEMRTTTASCKESDDATIRLSKACENTVNPPARQSAVTVTDVKAAPDASPFSISKFMPLLTKKMKEFSNSRKCFAYYFGHDAQLTAYCSGENDDGVSKLKRDLEQLLLHARIPSELIKVKVINSMPNTVHCCGGVGSTLALGRRTQHVGLYLTYQGSDSIYWLSSAHGYLQELRAQSNVGGPDHCLRANERTSIPVRISFQENVTGMPKDKNVDVHMLYLAYDYNLVPIQHTRSIVCTSVGTLDAIVDVVPQIIMCHSVDVLLGPAPLITRNLNPDIRNQARLTSAGNDYDALQDPANGREAAEQLYRITRLRLFNFNTDDNCATLDMGDIIGKVLICYLGGTGQLAKGTVTSCSYNQPMELSDGKNQFIAVNMLMIHPAADSCKAALGHSGSVWVLQAEDGSGYEAVAVTSAITRLPETDDDMWLAAPLCACLLALNEEYPQKFPDYRKFDVVK